MGIAKKDDLATIDCRLKIRYKREANVAVKSLPARIGQFRISDRCTYHHTHHVVEGAHPGDEMQHALGMGFRKFYQSLFNRQVQIEKITQGSVSVRYGLQDTLREQACLVLKEPINSDFANAGSIGDVVKIRPIEPVLQELPGCVS